MAGTLLTPINDDLSQPWLDEEISDYWRLPETFTIQQAALLVVGVDPASETGCNCDGWKVNERPRGYEAAKQGIAAALKTGRIKGVVEPEIGYDINHEPYPLEGTFDVLRSEIERESLVAWLSSRGFRRGFFFPEEADAPDYLDPGGPRYAPKLAAAIRAWQAVGDENLRRGKSAKQAMEQWIEANYKALGLVHRRDSGNGINGYKAGDMNKSAVREAAKVANWEEDGGAPSTPGA